MLEIFPQIDTNKHMVDCNPYNAHVALCINTINRSLIITVIRTDKFNGWAATIVLKDKTLSRYIGYDIAKQWLLIYTLNTLNTTHK